MPWATHYDAGLAVVETRYAGLLTPVELLTAVDQTIRLGQAHTAYRFLSDCSALAGGHSVTDLYGLVELLEHGGFRNSFREAIIMPHLDTAAPEVSFWEDACRNRGFEVRVFNTRDAALRWLLAAASAGHGPLP